MTLIGFRDILRSGLRVSEDDVSASLLCDSGADGEMMCGGGGGGDDRRYTRGGGDSGGLAASGEGAVILNIQSKGGLLVWVGALVKHKLLE